LLKKFHETETVTIQIPKDAKPGDTIHFKLKNGKEADMPMPANATPGKSMKVKVPVENQAGEVSMTAEVLEAFRRPKKRNDHPCAVFKTKNHRKTMTLMGRRVKVKNMSQFNVPEDSLGTVVGDDKVSCHFVVLFQNIKIKIKIRINLCICMMFVQYNIFPA
jgi:hypothetical protein